jgi:murein DD-endopeptidase MepM/ murein hydrolase activator NlpD
VSRRFVIFIAAIVALGAGTLTGVFRHLHAAERQFAREVLLARQQADRIRETVVHYTESPIAAGATFSQALKKGGVEARVAASIIGSASGVFDLRHVRAGSLLEIGSTALGKLRAVRYRIDPGHVLSIRFIGDVHGGDTEADSINARVESVPSRDSTIVVQGTVQDSLFNAVEDSGESPELAMRLAEIFGWDLDFYTDTREGDTFRLTVEKKTYLHSGTAVYGRILAAEYINDGRPYRAVLFHDASGSPAYYSADGKSLQKAFLRSPLKFAAPVTSHFSRSRFHPILRVYRSHLGTDFGAPMGTPVQSIGTGRVIFAGRKGGDGNMVHIRHTNGYETMYMHLSRILVHLGQHVEPGDRIGLVGMTGLATGPHLDFRIIDHGVFRNFETLRLHLPPAKPVPKQDLAEFVVTRDRALSLLDDTTLDARVTDAAPGAFAH